MPIEPGKYTAVPKTGLPLSRCRPSPVARFNLAVRQALLGEMKMNNVTTFDKSTGESAVREVDFHYGRRDPSQKTYYEAMG